MFRGGRELGFWNWQEKSGILLTAYGRKCHWERHRAAVLQLKENVKYEKNGEEEEEEEAEAR